MRGPGDLCQVTSTTSPTTFCWQEPRLWTPESRLKANSNLLWSPSIDEAIRLRFRWIYFVLPLAPESKEESERDFLTKQFKRFCRCSWQCSIFNGFPRYSSGTGPTLGLFTNDKRVSVVKNYHSGVTEREKKTNLNFWKKESKLTINFSLFPLIVLIIYSILGKTHHTSSPFEKRPNPLPPSQLSKSTASGAHTLTCTTN